MRRRTPYASCLFLLLTGIPPGGEWLPLCHAGISTQSVGGARDDRTLAEGARALERGDIESARILFEKVLRRDPNDSTALTYLGVIADGMNDLATAERYFAAAARLAPASASARNNYGAVLLRLNRTREAAEEFTASLRLDPRGANALLNLAQIKFAAGSADDLRAARDLFADANALAPNPDIARALVVISLRLNEKTLAVAHYRDYARHLSQASTPATGGSSNASRVELGLALLEADLAGEAIEELGGVLALDSTNVAAVIGFARAQLRRGDTTAAGRALERAVAQGVGDARLYATLADVYERAGRPENAIPAMRLALARDSKQEAYHFRYGMLLTDTKAPAAAIIRLQESLTAFPQSPRLWLALGVAQQAAGKNDEATKSFARAAEIDAKFAPAYAYLGATYDERGQYAEAVNYYLKTIEVDPDAAIAYYLVAEALLKSNTNDSKQIERHLRRAVALDNRFAQASASLGKLLLRTDRAAEAVPHLRHAVEVEPEFAQAYYQLGRALQRLRRTDEAQLALNTFKQLNDTQKKESEDKRRELVRRLADVRF